MDIELSKRIEQFIITDISPDLDLEQIGEEEPLIDSGIIDSLGILKILAFLDEEFGVDLSSEEIDLDKFSNIKTICAMVQHEKEKT